LLDLHGVLSCKGEACGKVKSVVTLTTKLREWSFGAESDAEMNDWLAAIKNALAALDSEHALVRIPARSEEGPADIIDALENLPEDAKAIVRGMGLAREAIQGPKEFPVLLNVLGFQTGRKLASAKYPNPYLTKDNDGTGGAQYTTEATNAGRR
jgi:hypothetical protein